MPRGTCRPKQHQKGGKKKRQIIKGHEKGNHLEVNRKDGRANTTWHAMTCSCLDLDLSLITSHHIRRQHILSLLPGHHPPVIIINSILQSSSHSPARGERSGKIQLGHVAASPLSCPCRPVSCQAATPSVQSREAKKEKQARPVSRAQGAIRTWLSPVPDGGTENGDCVGQPMDDSCRIGRVGLGSSDGSTTEKEGREEKKKRRVTR